MTSTPEAPAEQVDPVDEQVDTVDDPTDDGATSASGASGRLPLYFGLAGFVMFSALTLHQFNHFLSPSWDNAIYEQVISSWAHFQWPRTDVMGPDFNFFGNHFAPIVALVAPLYLLFPYAQTILLAQAALIAFSVYVVAKLAIEQLGRPVGITISLAYLFSFGLQNAILADFHEVAFAAPLLALAGAAYVRRDYDRVMWWSLALLLVKEDMGLTVLMVGVVLFLAKARRQAYILMGVGFVVFVLVVAVIMPLASSGADNSFGNFGTGDGPIATLFQGFGTKFETTLFTFGVTAFLSLRSPWFLLVLPTFGWRFVGDNEWFWTTQFHYSMPLMAILFVAMIDALVRVRADEKPSWPWLTAYAKVAPAAALAVVLTMLTTLPLQTLVKKETWAEDVRAEATQRAVDTVPNGASVVGDIRTINHLASNHETYWIGTVGDAQPDWIVLDVAGVSSNVPDVVAWGQQTFGGTWEKRFDEQGIVAAERVG